MNLNRSLIVGCGLEHLRFSRWNSGVLLNKLCSYPTHSLDTERERYDVEEKHVFNITGENSSLNSSTKRYHFVRVNRFVRLFVEKLFHRIRYCRHASLTSNQYHLINDIDFKGRDFHSAFCNFHSAVHELSGKFFEFSS